MEITPFIPLTIRGRLKGRGTFDNQAFGFELSFGFVQDLAAEIAAHLSGVRNDNWIRGSQ